jgi:hypothetical protein
MDRALIALLSIVALFILWQLWNFLTQRCQISLPNIPKMVISPVQNLVCPSEEG